MTYIRRECTLNREPYISDFRITGIAGVVAVVEGMPPARDVNPLFWNGRQILPSRRSHLAADSGIGEEGEVWRVGDIRPFGCPLNIISMSEEKTLEHYQDNFVSSRWAIKQFELPDAEGYLYDLENIVMADVGLLSALESNIFFEEACQLIANSIHLFKNGFYDTAFYSLRQSMEVSVGSLFLTANPSKMKAWKQQEPGFESGTMVNFLKENATVFTEMAVQMKPLFDNIRSVQKRINKYVHKQGYISFYSIQKYKSSDGRMKRIYQKITEDFEDALRTSIGAVAVYRLAIDPLPVLLMDDDIVKRTGDLLTMPYSERFVETYIGQGALDAYKKTSLFTSYKKSIEANEKQNDAVFSIIHFQYIDRQKIDDIIKQVNLLSFHDRVAVSIFLVSAKIPQIYIEGCFHYMSDVPAKHTDTVIGSSYYDGLFQDAENYNYSFKDGSFLSRVKINEEYSYIESNEPLDSNEIASLLEVSQKFTELYAELVSARKQGDDKFSE